MLLGATGQLGRTLLSVCKGLGFFVIPYDMRYFDEQKLSILVLELRLVQEVIIINAFAYTNVERAEIESERAFFLNRDILKILAKICIENDALLVHFSTDYVFDGSGESSWQESDRPNPLNIYGLSKLQGERAIVSSCCRYLILRTSWLHSPYRHNFLKTMLQMGNEYSPLSVVHDQIGIPTSAGMLAEVTLAAIRQILVNPNMSGLYHVAAVGEVSRYDYANFIFKEGYALGIVDRIPNIIPVTSCHYGSSVSRPLNSRLNTCLFSKTFDIYLPSWQVGVKETLQQLRL